MILSKHNKSILASKNIILHPPCNFRCKAESPLNDECFKQAIIYKASISTDGNNALKYYYGCCEMEFRSHFSDHCQSFQEQDKKKYS